MYYRTSEYLKTCCHVANTATSQPQRHCSRNVEALIRSNAARRASTVGNSSRLLRAAAAALGTDRPPPRPTLFNDAPLLRIPRYPLDVLWCPRWGSVSVPYIISDHDLSVAENGSRRHTVNQVTIGSQNHSE